MTITYGFFSSLAGTSDRSYTSVIEAMFYKWLFPQDGVISGESSELAVSATSPTADMYVHVAAGVAVAQGHYWLKSTATENLLIATADAVNPRKDIVVVRFRPTGDAYRDAILAVVTGTPAASPSAPALTQTSDTWEIELAEIAVGAGVTQILTANITDKRSTTLCGWLAAKLGKMHIEADGSLDAASLQIHNLADPTSDQDAATKKWITDLLAAGGVSGLYLSTTVKTSGATHTVGSKTNKIRVTVIGGGGGGGDTAATAYHCGTGGGGGGTAIKEFAVTPSTAYNCAIGAGGASVSAGGNSTFTVGATTITGGGGGAGIRGTTAAVDGPSGGTATNGDINIPGQPGKPNSTTLGGGEGGSSTHGFGGRNKISGAGTGYAGTGYGAGGGGAYNGAVATGNSGGAGSAGVIIIEEFT